MITYFAIIHKDTGSAYGVHFPDLPGCFSAGDTLVEAVANARQALALYVEDEEGIPPSRDLEALRNDGEVAKDLAAGGCIILVPLLIQERKERLNLMMPVSLLHALDLITSNRSEYISDLVRSDLEKTGAVVANRPVKRGRPKSGKGKHGAQGKPSRSKAG